jgi:hypothetical protein
LRKGEFYESEKYNGVPILIEVVDIYHEATGDYVILEIIELFPMLSPHVNLIISSVPERADIHIDGQYVGKTTKTIPIIDLDMHSLRLVLNGYEDAEQNFQFEPDNAEKEILITLNRIQQAPTPTPTPTPSTPMLVPHTHSPTPPPATPTLVPHTYSPAPATPTPTPTPTLVPHTYSPTPSTPATEATPVPLTPTPVPGFLAITVILAILCGFLILKKRLA